MNIPSTDDDILSLVRKAKTTAKLEVDYRDAHASDCVRAGPHNLLAT